MVGMNVVHILRRSSSKFSISEFFVAGFCVFFPVRL
jgi:hypothetical protein